MQSIKTLLLLTFLLAFTTQCSNKTAASLLSGGSPLMTALSQNRNLSMISDMLKTPGLEKMLGGALNGEFTLLAPTNEALNAMGTSRLSELSNANNVKQLAEFLKGHLVKEKLTASELSKGAFKSAAGEPLNMSGILPGQLISGQNFNILPVNRTL